MPLVVRRLRWDSSLFRQGSVLTVAHLGWPSWGYPYLPHQLVVTTAGGYSVDLHIRSVGRLEHLTEEEAEAEETSSSADEREGLVVRAVEVRKQCDRGTQTVGWWWDPDWQQDQVTQTSGSAVADQASQTPDWWGSVVSL